jgi:hypothetical protein
MAGAVVETSGLQGLIRAFQKMSRDVAQDFVWELQEAADPVRKRSTEIILSPPSTGMRNMPRTPFYADMRIGVAKAQGIVYVAPDWHRGSGAGTRRPNLADEFIVRMERALEENSDEVEHGVEKMLDRMADEWGAGA